MHRSCGDPLRAISDRLPSAVLTFFSPSAALVVGHPASVNACSDSGFPLDCSARSAKNSALALALTQSLAAGVAHPVSPVADMRRADARRRERDSPEGVAHGFHVSVYKVDPRPDSLACNLLSNDDWRRALLDEPGKTWPQMPWVRKPSSSACRAERLARTGTGPNRSIIGPSGLTQGIGPDADPGEEMALREFSQVIWMHILDRSFIDNAWRDMAGAD
jgi:hypothetical protein